MFAPLGGIYGNAFAHKGGIKEYWQQNQWFRITTYVSVTAVIIVGSMFVGPELFAGGGFSFTWTAAGAAVGAELGWIYRGTNGLKGGWNWESAAKGMMKGAMYGAFAGYSAGSAANAAILNEEALTLQGSALNPSSYGPFYGINSISWSIGAASNATSAYFVGGWILEAYLVYSIYAMPRMAEKMTNHRGFDILGYGYDFDDHERIGW